MVKIRPIMGLKFLNGFSAVERYIVKIRPIMGLKFPIVFIWNFYRLYQYHSGVKIFNIMIVYENKLTASGKRRRASRF